MIDVPFIFGKNYGREEILKRIGSASQLGGITKSERIDGNERGNRVIDISTGTGLNFTVAPDKGMDITRLFFKGIPCMWRSPNGDVSPNLFESQGMGWLRSFQGGMFATCGLTHFGSPCEDNGEILGIHGRVGNLPAYNVSADTYWKDDELWYKVIGYVRQSTVFGENLVLKRTILTKCGSTEIEIEDEVANEGFENTPHMILYHFNLGFPLISPDSTLLIHSKKISPRDDDAKKGLQEWNTFIPPEPKFREQVFHHDVEDNEDRVSIEVCNPRLKISWKLGYFKSELPDLFEWRMFGEGTYVLGLEPANSPAIQGRATARVIGKLPVLLPGTSRTYHLRISVTET